MSGKLKPVREIANSQGIVREYTLSWKRVPKTGYC